MSNNYNFSNMPDLNDQHGAWVDRAGDYFIGDPKKVLVAKKVERPASAGSGAGSQGVAKGGDGNASGSE